MKSGFTVRRNTMYHKIAGAGLPLGGTLAFTGMNITWYLVAAIALISTGLLIMRLVPRAEV